jgi:integrase
MARKEILTVKLIESLAPKARAYRVSDGGALLLAIYPGGSKAWLARTTINGRRRDVGLGGFPAITLAEARAKALEARRLAGEGRDPSAEKKAARADRIAAQAQAKLQAQLAKERSFEALAENYIAVKAGQWKGQKTAQVWRQSLRDHAPALGPMPVSEIMRDDIIRIIKPLWASHPATARKLSHRIGKILAHAAFKGYRQNDGIADVRVLIDNAILESPPGGKLRPALPWHVLPAFMAELTKRHGIHALALRFLILTAVRSNEARGARWSEIDFQASTWTLPGHRLKGETTRDVESHRVPLPTQALEILRAAYSYHTGSEVSLAELPRLAALKGNALIFAAIRDARKPLRDKDLSKILREMNGASDPPQWRASDGRPAVVHGFRSSFRTWTQDLHPMEAKAAEAQLGHRERNKVVAAYARSDLFARRVPLMAQWADHCHQVPGQVVTMPVSKPAREAKRRSS